jgi:hypothetical protein
VVRLLIAFGCLYLTLIVPSLMFPASVSRQDERQKRLLTNADVVELKRLGLDDAAIVERIRHSVNYFDTSAEGIRELEAAGVSQVIIREMTDAEKSTVVSSGQAASVNGEVQPKASTGTPDEAARDESSPARIDARERATMRANRPVPVAKGEASETIPTPTDAPTEPASETVTTTVPKQAAPLKAAPRHPKKRRKIPRRP